jgi:O-antigen ligase
VFDISTSHLIQLLLALTGGISLYVASYIGFQRAFFKALIVVIPFQFFTSVYGSFNMALTYVLGASMFLNQSWMRNGSRRNWPLLWAILLILISFFLSWIQAPRVFWTKNLFYFIMIVSNVVMFYMSYHFVSDAEDMLTFFKLLLFCNVLVILYCIIQLIVGFGEFRFLGIQEFSIQKNRTDYRLVGPFNAVGITAEYLVIQCLLLGYYLISMDKYRKMIIGLIFCNVAALVGTGNRGGFISFLVSAFLFVHFFRRELGPRKVMVLIASVATITVVASFVMIKCTDFNMLYDRMLGTRFDGVTPDTRSGWPHVIEKIFDKPILGHGPRLVTRGEVNALRKWPEGEIGFHPHNLYLYIFYTTGLIGFLCFTLLAIGYLSILRRMTTVACSNRFISGLPRLGIIIFFIFLLDQMKIEALRWYLLDYQHYLSTLCGGFLGLQNVFRNTPVRSPAV